MRCCARRWSAQSYHYCYCYYRGAGWFWFLLITGVFQSSRLGFQGGRGRPGAIDGADVGGAAVLAARRPGVAARELPGTQQRARSRGAVGVRRPVLPSSLVRFAVRG